LTAHSCALEDIVVTLRVYVLFIVTAVMYFVCGPFLVVLNLLGVKDPYSAFEKMVKSYDYDKK